MPELPEVESVKRYLSENLISRKITNIDIYYEKIIKGYDKLLVLSLIGEEFLEIKRFAKVLIFVLTSKIIVSHLGLEGRFYIYNNYSFKKHEHVVFSLDNATFLVYKDVRRFGSIEIFDKSTFSLESHFSNYGEEPFTITVDDFLSKLYFKTKTIKESLLDQSIISGIGNIYADEILFASLINPTKKSGLISKKEGISLIENAKIILKNSIDNGGTTFKSFESSLGVKGNYQNYLKIFNKKGEPCPRCQTPILKTRVGGRGTYYCPNCQKDIKIIAVTGNYGVGKSTVSSIFDKYYHNLIDCDKIVNDLYLEDFDLISRLVSEFHLTSSNIKLELKQKVKMNPKLINELNKIVHKFVFNKINDLIDEAKRDRVILEMPLLFETKYDKLVDYSVLVTTDNSLLKERLIKRDGENLFDYSKFQINSSQIKEKANYLIQNNSNILQLEEEVLKIIHEIN
ncbi:MAG: bifunctional DNA-formamidopyrimidine glycosylase/DNA-(apurinic or apyrimidinic site) lyase [Acholeplasmatales bacterium]|jgi:formamidopyrimidine-DNA glycosylase|nr:bifunctional DNA-formamidopyrimidine glycosylase/DNA-(apurinic or apyrimidinic site) lyase [Acholeplasmatales bacterium]